MIKIDTKDVNEKTFESNVQITGSGKEIIRDFYVLHDVIKKIFQWHYYMVLQ